MMGQLLRDELGFRRLPPDDLSARLSRSETETWLGVFLAEGQRIGHVHLKQAPETRHESVGVRMVLQARMQLELLGKHTDLDLSGSVWRPEEANRAEFDFAVRSAGFDFEVAGRVENGELRGEMMSAGEMIPLVLPVDDSLVFSGGLGSALHFPRLDVGDELRLDSFDPLTLSKSDTKVRCVARETLFLDGKEVSTCRLTVSTGGLSSLAWIDDRGEIVRAETPVGLVLERLTPAQARQPLQPPEASAESLLAETAIRPTGVRPFRSARTMKVKLGGVANLRLPEDRVQTALGADFYLLRRPEVPAAATGDTSRFERYLQPDAFVQSDHPRIRRQAEAIIQGEEDPWQRALKIQEWVFSRLEKEPVVSIPSALEVLEQQRGDCNEHTVLFTALARAVSLPTRIAIGIVWSEDLEGFYYHAWPEVRLEASNGRPDSGWYWMDPTLGQPLADATHIKLLNGGIETWPQLLPYLGKLEIEVLEVE